MKPSHCWSDRNRRKPKSCPVVTGHRACKHSSLTVQDGDVVLFFIFIQTKASRGGRAEGDQELSQDKNIAITGVTPISLCEPYSH
jgi:hypothetical protein